MSSEAADQSASAEDVSFADVLEQPEGPKAAPSENDGNSAGDTAGQKVPPEPMEVSDGPPGAAGDAGSTTSGGSGGVAPPPGVTKPGGSDDNTPAPEAPAAAEGKPAPSSADTSCKDPSSAPAESNDQETPKETSNPATESNVQSKEATAEEKASAAEPIAKETTANKESATKEKTPAAEPAAKETTTNKESAAKEKTSAVEPTAKATTANKASATKEKTSADESTAKATTAVKPSPTSTPAAASKPAAVSNPTVKSEPAASKPAVAPNPAAKSGAPAKKAAPVGQSRPIPADAEPIRVFSSVAGPKTKPKVPTPEPEPVTELDKLWKPVKQNPADFTAWTLLIQYVEAQCFMEDIRAVLKAFLARYPYCYGYWKKYSDLEKKRGTPELCNEVFERGLAAVPLSVDLWLHYLHHMRTVYESRPELVRAAFERAVAACGTEFRSDRLWEQYASWETSNNEPVRALAVYKRAIAVPTLSYRTHFENLEQFVGETAPQDLLTVGEFLEARRAVLAELKASEPAAAAAPPSSDLLPPGCDEPPPGVPAQPAGLSADEEGVKLRARILAPLRQLHKDTEKQVSLRWNFEEGIKRPYFHVKPLEKTQLKNWKAYLDFEIEQGDQERIRVLFERCMISCALYEEYWMKYIRYLESRQPADPDQVRAVFRRACWTHLPSKPAIHLMWATFEERQGDLEAAADVMTKISAQVTMLEVLQRRVNVARRAGRLDTAEQMYADALKVTEHRETAVIIAIKFVRFLYKVRDNRAKALEVLREAIHHDPASMRLYMQLVDIGFQSRPVDVALVEEAFQMALEAPFEQKDKLTLLHRRIEFLEEFGNDIEKFQTAQEEYHSLLKAVKAEAKKKKQAEDQAAPAAGKRAAAGATTNGTEKKARVEPATAAAAASSGAQIPTITETPARPAKTVPHRAPPPAAAAAPVTFNQPPPGPAPGFGGFNQPPPQQQQQPFQYQGPGYNQQQQQGMGGWPGYPPQYNYGQYGQGYQYPYQ